MLKAIQENAGDQPVVITGDFNANMNETPSERLEISERTDGRVSWENPTQKMMGVTLPRLIAQGCLSLV